MYLTPLDECQLELIKKEDFYQTPERVDEDVTQLIEWLSKQPHLPNITEREWLTNFIVSCKYNLQKSKKVIEVYFITRAEYPEYFQPLTMEKIKNLQISMNVYLLPKLMSNATRILYAKINPTADDTNFDVLTCIKYILSVLDLQLKTEPMHGEILLFDIEYFQLSHFLAFTPTLTKNFFNCVFESFPMRVRSIHFIHPPIFMNRILMFIKMFMPKKIKERIMVHDNLTDLFEHIPKDVLPDIYGGTCGSIEQLDRDMMDFMCSNIEWLNRRKKADLSKRPEKNTLDKMDGTFKKLQID